ncbi:MAG: hypothetical protein HFJ59_00725 [Clostridia bacterium]|nr:hypothetical protein [Clostridia bacterium]
MASQFIETAIKGSSWRVRYVAINDNPKVSTEILQELIHDDSKAYADFNKTIPFEKYKFPIGYVFDKR